jgi:hypothetical protein
MVRKTLTSIAAGLLIGASVVAFAGCSKQDNATTAPTAPPAPEAQQQLSAVQQQRANEAAYMAQGKQQAK